MSGSGIKKIYGLIIFIAPLYGEQITVHASRQGASVQEPITATLRARPNRVVRGQESSCVLEVIYDPRRVSIRGLTVPTYDEFVFQDPFQGPQREQVEVAGSQMVRLTWSAALYPRKSGSLKLPGIGVEYGRIEERKGTFGGVFSWAFQQDDRLYTLTTDDLVLTVDPLPNSGQIINAVGNYNSFFARVDRSLVNQGEAITMSIELRGVGNAGFEQAFSPVLPAGCTCYPDHIQRMRDGVLFKFVVQCNQPGTIEIPTQKIVCYNPLTKQFNTLASGPLPLTVIPHERAQGDGTGQIVQENEDGELESVGKERLEIPYGLFLIVYLLLILGAAGWRWRKQIARFCVRARYKICRACRLFTIWIAVRRGRLVVRDAYQFFLTYSEHDITYNLKDRDGWADFWIDLQSRYFGGAPDAVFSQSEGERVWFWAKRIKPRCPESLKTVVKSLHMRDLLFVLIAGAGLVILYACYERSGARRYLLVDTALYLGPGSGYPVRKGLVAGDEVRLVRRAPEKTDSCSWVFVDACGEKGWLPHDVFV